MRGAALFFMLGATACYSGLSGGASDPDGDPGSGSAADGGADEGGDDDGSRPPDDDAPPGGDAAVSGLRRLTRGEYDNTVEDLLGDTTRPAGSGGLPEELSLPFLNDYRDQIASGTLIEGAERLAKDVAARLVGDPTRLATVLPCAPDGPMDQACMRQFVTEFGRRVFRRPLTAGEVDGFASLQGFAVSDSPHVEASFETAVELAVGAMLQDVNFLYRVELGEEVQGRPGVYHLGDYEVATRLSYLVWGSTPDDALLDLAGAGELRSAGGRTEAAQRMLEDPRAVRQLDEFHAQWLGYRTMLVSPELQEAMRAETRALLQRAAFEDGHSYLELFTASETYVASEQLAAHYGLDGAEPGWVSLAGTGRGGILGQGTFLSAHNNFDDTSPVKRGAFVREWLMCQEVPPPPPEVSDELPDATSESPCRVQRLKDIHHADPTCAACHTVMDPIGFGLENYDRAGAFRTAEVDDPETEVDEAEACPIDGEGALPGVGEFNGPAGLGTLLAESGALDACVVRQLHRFAVGRAAMEDGSDDALLEALTEQFTGSEHDMRALLSELVGRDEFVLRRNEEA